MRTASPNADRRRRFARSLTSGNFWPITPVGSRFCNEREHYMRSKHWLLIIVVAALLAWAGVETQRLYVAHQQMAASLAVQKATTQRAEMVRLKYAQASAGQK